MGCDVTLEETCYLHNLMWRWRQQVLQMCGVFLPKQNAENPTRD